MVVKECSVFRKHTLTYPGEILTIQGSQLTINWFKGKMFFVLFLQSVCNFEIVQHNFFKTKLVVIFKKNNNENRKEQTNKNMSHQKMHTALAGKC